MRIFLTLTLMMSLLYGLYTLNPKPSAHTLHLTQFVSLSPSDDCAVAKLQTLENIHHVFVKHIPHTDIPYGKIDAQLSVMAHYTYAIKLSELRFDMKDDVLVFKVPRLYLMTPVAHDSATLNRTCHSVLLASCKNTLNTLMTEVSSVLADRGQAQIPIVYDSASKALADHFDTFMKLNHKPPFYRAIEVIFEDEVTPSRRVFMH